MSALGTMYLTCLSCEGSGKPDCEIVLGEHQLVTGLPGSCAWVSRLEDDALDRFFAAHELCARSHEAGRGFRLRYA